MEFLNNPLAASRILLLKSSLVPFLSPWQHTYQQNPDEIASLVGKPFNPGQPHHIVYQGQPIITGVIISHDGEFDSEHYLSTFESIDKHNINLNYSLKKNQIKASSQGMMIPEEISTLHFSDQSPTLSSHIHRLTLPKSSSFKFGAILFYRIVTMQIPKHHLDTLATLTISLDITTTNPMDIMAEDRNLRNIIEEHRYQSHVEKVSDLSLDISVRNPIQVSIQSVEVTTTCASIWGISVANMMKDRPLTISNLLINLKASIRIDTRGQGDDENDESNPGGVQYTSSSYCGSDVCSAYSDDSILFNYTIQGKDNTSDSIDSLYTISPIMHASNKTLYPVVVPAKCTFTFAYSIIMNRSAFLKSTIDDLAAQYITPFSLWWTADPNPGAHTNIASLCNPSFHNMYWSVGSKNLEWIQTIIPPNKQQQLPTYDNASNQMMPVVDDIHLSITCPPRIAINIPTTVQLTIENRSTRMLRQLVINKREYPDIPGGMKSSGQYYIHKYADPFSVMPMQTVTAQMIIIATLSGVFDFKDLLLQDLEPGRVYLPVHYAEIVVVA